jgi:hypothetical protein
MISIVFRVVDENGEPTGWYGLAANRNWEEVFWDIDEHVDPYMVEVHPIRGASVCWRQSKRGASSVEVSDRVAMKAGPDSALWKKPVWAKDPDWRERKMARRRNAEQ